MPLKWHSLIKNVFSVDNDNSELFLIMPQKVVKHLFLCSFISLTFYVCACGFPFFKQVFKSD